MEFKFQEIQKQTETAAKRAKQLLKRKPFIQLAEEREQERNVLRSDLK